MDKNRELIIMRIKSFAYSAGALVVASLIGVFVSDDFAALVQSHVGSGLTGTLLMLAFTEAVKHVRNKVLIGRAVKRMGSFGTNQVDLI